MLFALFLTYLLTLEAVTEACKEPEYRKRPKRCFVSTDPVSDLNLILIIRANCEYLKSLVITEKYREIRKNEEISGVFSQESTWRSAVKARVDSAISYSVG